MKNAVFQVHIWIVSANTLIMLEYLFLSRSRAVLILDRLFVHAFFPPFFLIKRKTLLGVISHVRHTQSHTQIFRQELQGPVSNLQPAN